jgi:5'-deoxynucleotidase YfbR-like HD superfamily hydrolase
MTNIIQIPRSIEDQNGQEICFDQIHRQFADSELGQKLAQEVRYKRYKPESISNKDWCRAPLGADMNNLAHMALTAGLAREYLKNQEPDEALNLADAQILMLAATTHDWAEAVTGDIIFDLKTADDDAKEATIMYQLLKKYLGETFSVQTLSRVYETITDKSSRLGEIFNAIERVGYLRSGLNAWNAGKKMEGEFITEFDRTVEKDFKRCLLWLASNVAGNQIPILLKYTEKYHPIAEYISNARERIDNLFSEMPESIFESFPEEVMTRVEQEQQKQKFQNSKAVWEKSHFVLDS